VVSHFAHGKRANKCASLLLHRTQRRENIVLIRLLWAVKNRFVNKYENSSSSRWISCRKRSLPSYLMASCRSLLSVIVTCGGISTVAGEDWTAPQDSCSTLFPSL